MPNGGFMAAARSVSGSVADNRHLAPATRVGRRLSAKSRKSTRAVIPPNANVPVRSGHSIARARRRASRVRREGVQSKLSVRPYGSEPHA